MRSLIIGRSTFGRLSRLPLLLLPLLLGLFVLFNFFVPVKKIQIAFFNHSSSAPSSAASWRDGSRATKAGPAPMTLSTF